MAERLFILKQSYYKTAQKFWPQVNAAFESMQTTIYNELVETQQSGESIDILADCAYESVGHCANKGAETFMVAESRLIVDSVCLDKADVGGVSNRIEIKALKDGLETIQRKGINITSLTTDRSKAVISLMKNDFSEIYHYFDLWHLAKSVAKALRAVIFFNILNDVTNFYRNAN